VTERVDLRDLLGEDVAEEELERLRRVHELLLEAGPPPELSPTLASAPGTGELPRQEELGWLPPRRIGRVLTFAAGFAAVALAAGYLVGRSGHGFDAQFSKAMHGTQAAPAAQAVIKVASLDDAGNWPLQLKVTGLRRLPSGGYYELWLTQHKRPAASCGTFRVEKGQTTVRLNAPYNFRNYDGWIVTEKLPGRPESTTPPLLTT
jgi:hypothetical protein